MTFRRILLLLLFIANIQLVEAQLPNGSTAPDVTFTDLDGNSHNLYDILDQGKSVIFDCFATWCGPCWNYHNSHILEQVYNNLGPAGTGEVEVFAIETSPSTNQACLYGPTGCSGGTTGDWVTGTPYPIAHISASNAPNFTSQFGVSFYPTLYKICPNRKIYYVGQPSYGSWLNWVGACDLDATETVSNTVCFGDAQGGIDLDVMGGTGNITYQWSNGANTQDINNVAAGNYSCTVSEGLGHSIEIGPFMVDGPSAPLNPEVVNINDLACFDDGTGAVDIEVSGGGTSFTYQWSNGATTQDLVNVNGDNYILTVTDNLGCEELEFVQVFAPPLLNLAAVVGDENCQQLDGSITLFSGGGTGSYIYDIGEGPTNSNVFLNLPAGTYQATVTDENNCEQTTIATIANIPGPNADAGPSASVSCANPTSTLDGSGSETGTDITYSWATTDGNIVSGENTLNPVVDQPGTYEIAVTNNDSGCESIATTTVTGSVNLPVADAGDGGELNCQISSITLNGEGSDSGTAISYEWFDESNTSIGTTVMVDVNTAGNFELVVTNDVTGCSSTSTVAVTENTALPTADAGSGGQLNCAVNTITLDGSGSSTGATIDYQWTDAAGMEIGTDATVTVSTPDTYTLLVSNSSNGCSTTSSVTVTENTANPNADAGTDQTLTCMQVEATLNGTSSASGANVFYSWTDENGMQLTTSQTVTVTQPGTYTFSVIDGTNNCTDEDVVVVNEDATTPTADAGTDDELNCANSTLTVGGNSSTGGAIAYAWYNDNNEVVGTAATLDVSNPGTFTLEVSNMTNGCMESDQVVITENTNLPAVDAGSDAQLDCNVSTVTLSGTASGSSGNFEYEWKNSAGTVVGNDPNIDVSSADIYTLLVTDLDNSCSSSDVVEVTASTDFPDAVAAVSGPLTCTIDQVELAGQGSSTGGVYAYEWTNEDGQTIASTLNTTIEAAGTYTLEVYNTSNGCSASAAVVVENNVEAPTAEIEADGYFNCNNTAVTLDGSASAGSNLSYSWTNVQGAEISTSSTAEVTNSGLYYLEVVDGQNGCSDVQSFAVTELPDVEVSATPTPVSCHGEATGSATAIANGGAGNFTFLWSDDQTTATATGLAAGVYFVTATDDDGCTDVQQIEITAPSVISIDISTTNETGDNQNDGTASASAAGGAADFTYAWSNGSSGPTIDNLSPGSYTLSVTDQNGCEEIAVINISAFNCSLQAVAVKTDLSCADENNGTITINVQQGEANSYTWAHGPTTASLDNLSAGIYQYTVTDATNCEINGQVEIIAPALIAGTISDVQDISCAEGQGGSATVTGSGGTGALSYTWSNGETGTTASQLVPGDNWVTILDENNCELSISVFIDADEDTESPVALTQNITVNLDAAGNAVINAAQINNGSTDNCGIANFSLSQSTFDCTEIGAVTVLLTVTDISGNDSSKEAVVTVVDDQIPTIACIDNVMSNSCGAVAYAMPTVVDNCSNYTLELIEGLASGANFPEGSTMVTYRVTDPGGNTADCSFEVVVAYDLAAEITASDALCNGEASGSAIALPTGGTAGYEYVWSNGQETAMATSLPAGDYEVSITDNTGCQVIQSVSIAEPAALEFVLDNLTNDDGSGNGSIDITASGGVPNYSYTWTKDGVFFSNEEDLTGLSAGNYAIEILDENGCTVSKFGLIVEETTATNELSVAGSIGLMPNPAKGQVWLDMAFDNNQEVTVEIFHASGKLMSTVNIGNVLEKRWPLNIEGYTSGLYLFRIWVGTDVIVRRVVVLE